MCEDTLKRIKKALESSFRKMNVSVAIDISQPAIKEIENGNTGLFQVERYGYNLLDRARLNETIFSCFNSKIDPAIQETYLELIKTLCPIV